MKKRRVSRAVIRQMVVDRSEGRCDWPSHYHAGDELAHLHSIGLGGNPSGDRDAWNNVAFLCTDAARVSDGERGSGGAAQYREFHVQLFGPRFLVMVPSFVGWERAEALKRHIESRYG